jgi:transposase
LLLSPGNTHDVIMAPALVEAAGPVARLLADKAYDTNPFRTVLADKAIEPVIPSIRRRKPLIPYDPIAYRQRNLIERMFCRLKDFRRVHALRQARQKLPRVGHPRRHHNLVDQLSPDPNLPPA